MISVNNTSAKAKNKLATQEYGTGPTKVHPFLMHTSTYKTHPLG